MSPHCQATLPDRYEPALHHIMPWKMHEPYSRWQGFAHKLLLRSPEIYYWAKFKVYRNS
jgi:hypothetical protein